MQLACGIVKAYKALGEPAAFSTHTQIGLGELSVLGLHLPMPELAQSKPDSVKSQLRLLVATRV